jgi:hypothetical protein
MLSYGHKVGLFAECSDMTKRKNPWFKQSSYGFRPTTRSMQLMELKMLVETRMVKAAAMLPEVLKEIRGNRTGETT